MDRFSICQAFNQLESDYNQGGWLRERPSNQRRRESIGCQLARLGYSNPHGWVEIELIDSGDDAECNDVRDIYMRHVLKWDLPISAELMTAMHNFFTQEFLAQYPQCAGLDYKQNP